MGAFTLLDAFTTANLGCPVLVALAQGCAVLTEVIGLTLCPLFVYVVVRTTGTAFRSDL